MVLLGMDRYVENSARDVDCPYCGERITVFIDTSAGPQQYVEDCQVCCRPIEFVVIESADGAFDVSLRTDAE